MLRRKRKNTDDLAGTFELYYASDVHGSEQCWRKFLGAGRFYGAQALIMGGDLTGKAIVPITADGDSFKAHFLGEDQSGKGQEQLDKLEDAIRYNGMYPWVASAADVQAAHDDANLRSELFEKVMVDELQRWIDLADERMSEYGIHVYVMPGNDDPWSCDPVLEGASHVQACDERVVQVGPHEMISCAFANPTPWNSPRELDEDALYTKIKALADQVESPETSIFNLHVPPYDSGLDTRQRDRRRSHPGVQERPAEPCPGRQHRGAPDHRGIPATAGITWTHPRVERGGPHRSHALHQLRIRVQQRPHSRRHRQAGADAGRDTSVRDRMNALPQGGTS